MKYACFIINRFRQCLWKWLLHRSDTTHLWLSQTMMVLFWVSVNGLSMQFTATLKACDAYLDCSALLPFVLDDLDRFGRASWRRPQSTLLSALVQGGPAEFSIPSEPSSSVKRRSSWRPCRRGVWTARDPSEDRLHR